MKGLKRNTKKSEQRYLVQQRRHRKPAEVTTTEAATAALPWNDLNEKEETVPRNVASEDPATTTTTTTTGKRKDRSGSDGGDDGERPPSSRLAVAAVAAVASSTTSKKRKKKKKRKRAAERTEDAKSDPPVSPEAAETVTVVATATAALATSNISSTGPDFPFPTDADDHCESPLEAYRDIAPFLTQVAVLLQLSLSSSSSSSTKKARAEASSQLRIYDPYYCDGAVIRNLAALGFPNVYNRKEDCYAVWAASASTTTSSFFDVLVTNPPYSDNHMERLIRYVTCAASSFGSTNHHQRPWFLLLPQWVHKKDYYVAATAAIRPFYLVPREKRYVYVPPKHFRAAKKSDVHKKSSPFVSMWYCWGGCEATNDALMQHYCSSMSSRSSASAASAPSCDLARSKSALRDLRRKQR